MSARPLFAFILPPPLALQLAALCLVLCLCCFLAPLKLRRATAPSKPCPVLSCLPCGACVCVCVQRRRLVAQCAERLAEYRHLVHAAATGNADEAAARVSQNLDTLEAGQVSAHLNPSPQPHTRRDLIRDDSRHRVCRHIVQPPHLSSR